MLQIAACWLVVGCLCVPSGFLPASILNPATCCCEQKSEQEMSATCCKSNTESKTCCSTKESALENTTCSFCVNESNSSSCCSETRTTEPALVKKCSKDSIDKSCQCGDCGCGEVVDLPKTFPVGLPPESNKTEIEHLTFETVYQTFDVQMVHCSKNSLRSSFNLNARTSQQTCAILSRFTC